MSQKSNKSLAYSKLSLLIAGFSLLVALGGFLYTMWFNSQQNREMLLSDVYPNLFNYDLNIIETHQSDFPAIIQTNWNFRVTNIGNVPFSIYDHNIQQLSQEYPNEYIGLDAGLFNAETGDRLNLDSPIEPGHTLRFTWQIGLVLKPEIYEILKDLTGETTWYEVAEKLSEANMDLCGNSIETVGPGRIRYHDLSPTGPESIFFLKAVITSTKGIDYIVDFSYPAYLPGPTPPDWAWFSDPYSH